MLDGKHWRLLGPLGFSFSGYLATISKVTRTGRSQFPISAFFTRICRWEKWAVASVASSTRGLFV